MTTDFKVSNGKKTKIRMNVFFGENQINGFPLIVFYIMLAAILCVFIKSDLQTLTGPILTVCFVYLHIKGYQSLVTAIILIANDALGCIVFGRISFTYLLLVLLILSIVMDRLKMKVKRSELVAFVFVVIVVAVSYMQEDIDMKIFVYTLSFILAAIYCVRTKNKTEMFFKGVAITVFLIAVHACVTGGVEYYELNEYSIEYLRRGVLGVGNGDSNYSMLLLNIGVTCTLFDRDFRWYTKIIMVATSVLAMTVTLSTSGLIGVILILIGFAFIKRESFPQKIRRALFIFLTVVLVVMVYLNLPEDMKIEAIDAYVERMEEKLGFLRAGNIASFTTNRSSIFEEKWEYIFEEQGTAGMLFGGNSLKAGSFNDSVPHNTYLDLLLQIGLLGTVATLAFIVRRGVKTWKDETSNRRDVLLKALFLFYFLNLSIYQDSLFALAYVCLIIL